MPRVIYAVSGLSEWVEVAARLESAAQWIPVYWLTQASKNHAQVQQAYPAVVSHPSQDANRCVFPQDLAALALRPVDPPVLRSLAAHEAVAMDLMDRMDLGGSFTLTERRRAWRRLVAFWLGVTERLGVDIVVFNTPPHSIAEYVLYAVACHRGIETPIFLTTGLGGYVYIEDRVDAVPAHLQSDYRARRAAGSAVALDDDLAQLLTAVRGSETQATPWYLKLVRAQQERSHERYERRRHRKALWRLARRFVREDSAIADDEEDTELAGVASWLREADASLKQGKKSALKDAKTPTNRVFKRPGSALEASTLSRHEYRCYRRAAYEVKLRYRELYQSLCTKAPEHAPYVYLALHYQPERTTCPDGGVFNDQLLIARMLSHCLPDDWVLRVREHPTQFSFTGNGEQARSKQFYRDLAELPRTHLVNLDDKPLPLIDGARAVATVTGMSGWEAVCRGVPAMVFGNAWYRASTGVFSVSTLDECHEAMNAIAAGMQIDPREVDTFAVSVKAVGRNAFVNASNAPGAGIDTDENASALADLLLDYERRKERASSPRAQREAVR